MGGIRSWLAGAVVLAGLLIGTGAAGAEDPVIEDVLEILRERGIVDEQQHAALVSKNREYENERAGLLGRIELWGDMRVRLEGFAYANTALDEDRPDRSRGRYRLRLNGRAAVNEYIDAYFQIASGEAINFDEGANRSANRTLGRTRDFGLSPIFIARAYLNIKAPSSWIGEASSLAVQIGKVKNPFVWKHGPDVMLWDHDLNPEGVSVTFRRDMGSFDLFANAGYFIADENSTTSDPHLFGIQGGASSEIFENVTLGGRLSYYDWASLNPAFRSRGARFGNIQDGIGSQVRVGELTAFARFDHFDDWPILLFGQIAQNFSAKESALAPSAGKEDLGWLVAAQVGDKKKYAALGAGYTWMEANFWPGQFTDSNILDGFTNRKGFMLFATREILRNTDLKLEVFASRPIRTALPDFENSLALSERVRFRADIQVKF